MRRGGKRGRLERLMWPSTGKFDDDDASEWLGGGVGSCDGRELGADLDGGGDHVWRGVGTTRFYGPGMVQWIVLSGVIGCWRRLVESGVGRRARTALRSPRIDCARRGTADSGE